MRLRANSLQIKNREAIDSDVPGLNFLVLNNKLVFSFRWLKLLPEPQALLPAQPPQAQSPVLVLE